MDKYKPSILQEDDCCYLCGRRDRKLDTGRNAKRTDYGSCCVMSPVMKGRTAHSTIL